MQKNIKIIYMDLHLEQAADKLARLKEEISHKYSSVFSRATLFPGFICLPTAPPAAPATAGAWSAPAHEDLRRRQTGGSGRSVGLEPRSRGRSSWEGSAPALRSRNWEQMTIDNWKQMRKKKVSTRFRLFPQSKDMEFE